MRSGTHRKDKLRRQDALLLGRAKVLFLPSYKEVYQKKIFDAIFRRNLDNSVKHKNTRHPDQARNERVEGSIGNSMPIFKDCLFSKDPSTTPRFYRGSARDDTKHK